VIGDVLRAKYIADHPIADHPIHLLLLLS